MQRACGTLTDGLSDFLGIKCSGVAQLLAWLAKLGLYMSCARSAHYRVTALFALKGKVAGQPHVSKHPKYCKLFEYCAIHSMQRHHNPPAAPERSVPTRAVSCPHASKPGDHMRDIMCGLVRCDWHAQAQKARTAAVAAVALQW
jgi:hypothetical protein